MHLKEEKIFRFQEYKHPSHHWLVFYRGKVCGNIFKTETGYSATYSQNHRRQTSHHATVESARGWFMTEYRRYFLEKIKGKKYEDD